MKKREIIILSLILIGILIFLIFPKTGWTIQSINSPTLKTLKEKAEVECLQNSQCSEDEECINNACINQSLINSCSKISLNTPTRKLKEGDSINSIKEILTKTQLPYLLSGGEFVEIVNGEPIEYFYVSYLVIGDNKIKKETDYILDNQNPIYTYKIVFSKGVDFSNPHLQGQILRIFGEEYTLSTNSNKSIIELISDNKIVVLQDGDYTQITKDEKGNVLVIEFLVSSSNKIKNMEFVQDSFFNSSKLSFKHLENNFVEIEVGGNC